MAKKSCATNAITSWWKQPSSFISHWSWGKRTPSYTIAATHADEEPSKGLQGEKPPTAEGVLKARAEAASDRVDSRVWPIATGTALMGIAIGVVLPVLPGLTRELGLNSTQFGMVISILGLTRLFCNIPLASIGNRMGRKSLLVAGPVLCSISMFMHGHSYSFEQLMFWRFVQGAGSAMMMMGAQLHLADISTNRNRARTMAPMSAAWSAGVSCGPALGGYLADSYGFQAPFMFVGMAIAVVALNNALRIKETSTVQRLETGMELAKQIGSDMRRTSTRWTVLMRDCRNTRAVLMLHSTFWATASGAQFTLLPLLATSQFDATPGSLGQLFASLAIVNVIMSQPSAYFSDTFGRKTSMVPGTMLVSAAIGLTPFAQSWEQLMGLVVMWGFGNSILGTAPTSFLVDITKDRDRSDALALMRSGGDLGLLVGATASGLIAHSYGVGTAMACNSVLLAATSVSFALASTEPKFHLKQAGKTHPSTRKPASTTPPATPVEDISVVTQTHSPTSMFPNASSVERRTQTKK
ncbi:hypothetical protein SARC_11098 [Sphaeroforma arctica JP610]|uniref:Major facilitator superfamily (MFS) profile domain-containing protein n=1 Tax=Sphaeroforma arctica JP610 TaxID=667725 RepID=A0A0L0FHY2_9EUKA|nr:hypothetical protein SARC_11098 [Sphaeroforma arctica JP610]KNC76399.1 hypothetical protein SARC_11098 [Sphaeroforma arctica JP610]|eukprot:XP_014150301.1 hypothetical protein SARC_11098 [Sphaeroforma arctica JP610]